MCGLLGFYGKWDVDYLKRGLKCLGHRGPDDNGVWVDAERDVGLGHVRLSIQDLSDAGHQPMVSQDHRWVLVFNGEIYNAAELRTNLEAMGVTFRGQSDTEVLLNSWALEGPGCLGELNGIFSLAIWDNKKCELFIARDSMGVKPLYYSSGSNGVTFASEMKAILQDPNIDRSLDIRAVRDHLTYMYCPGPRTMIKSIKKLMPGEWLCIDKGVIKSQGYVKAKTYDQNLIDCDLASATQQVREALRTAVHRQMVSDVPVGAFLSGGLDSSAVVAFARENYSDGEFPCFTISSGKTQGFSDDLPYAKKVAKHLGVKLDVLEIKPSIIERLDQMLWHLDEPQSDPAAINVLLISEQARECGIKVLLGGTGGDDIFTGYRRHFALTRERLWSWLPRSARSAMRIGTGCLPKKNASLRRIAKAFAYADYAVDDRMLGYFRWALPDEIDGLFNPDHKSQLANDPFCEGLRSAQQAFPGTGINDDRLHRMLHLEQSHFLVDHNLNYTDKLSMAVGVEARVPLLDRDLVALSCRLPAGMKQFGAEGKYIFKKAMEGILPDDVIYRSKTGFGAPLRDWIKGELREVIEDTLSREKIEKRGLFNAEAVSALIEENQKGRTDASYTIFGLLCIERWCKLFIDDP